MNISSQAGVRFKHYSGANGRKYMPETVGSGCAFLDYDGDGKLDLLFVNSTDWPSTPAGRRSPHSPTLYRNQGDGTFADVTASAGLEIDVYGMGVAVADYDNDGDSDVFLSCLGPNYLFRNDGNGKFTDVTKTAGVQGDPVDPGGLRWKWSSCTAWVDYDRDGKLDLYVGNYVKWTPATDVWCGEAGVKSYCPPTSYEGLPSLLYRNLGNGRFANVSAETGISRYAGKAFGVAVADYNQDSWPDLAVSNDTKENYLFLNEGGRGFREMAVEAGIAMAPSGVARAGMGIDADDWAGTGRFGILIGNFSREGLALYRNDGNGLLEDVAYPAQIGPSSLLSLTFGCFFFDFDLDGVVDIFAANGHIDDFVRDKDAMITYEQLPLLYRGKGDGTFAEVTANAGPAMRIKRVLRGAAHGDFDNDGDPDIAVVWNNRSGELWQNGTKNAGHWIGLSLQGVESNRDGIGAVIRVKTAARTRTTHRRSGGSFLSESDPRVLVGLGDATQADQVEVTWPSGKVDVFRNVSSGRYYRVIEGRPAIEPQESGSWVK